MVDSIMIGGVLHTVKVKQKNLHKFMGAWNKVYIATLTKVRKRVEKTCNLPMRTTEEIRDRIEWIDIRVDEAMAEEKLIGSDWLFYWIVWKCLEKKGWWPLKKPFRSLSHMMKETLSEEFLDVVKFVGEKVMQEVNAGKK